MIDIRASLDTLERNEHIHPSGPWKLSEDLARYEKIIEESQPDLIIEAGTRTGESARWFALVGNCRVITVDVLTVELRDAPLVATVTGDSTHYRTYDRVCQLAERAGAERIMVSLDSNHSSKHVRMEIAIYGQLVSVGCYLVIEDGIFHYANEALRAAHEPDMVGDPLDAILGSALPHSRRWSRNTLVEDMYPVTHHPAGWWRRIAR